MWAPQRLRAARSLALVVLASCVIGIVPARGADPGHLNVLGIKIKQSKPGTTASGVATGHGDLTTLPGGATFDASLGVAIEIKDSYLPPPGPLDLVIAWDGTECATNRNGKTRCKSADGLQALTLVSFPKTPNVYKFRLRVKGLTLEGPFLQPVTVTFTNAAVWDDVLDECRATVTGIVCKKL
jgi:hypothetical protein